MVDPNVLFAELVALLKGLRDFDDRVYDGYAPDKIPTSGEFIKPYLLVMAGIGSDLEGERDLTQAVDQEVLDWNFQINAVGPTPSTARQAAQVVRRALTDHALGGGWIKPDGESFRNSTPVKDTQVSPARFFLPLQWRLTTN